MTAINNTWQAFGNQIYKDLFSESGGFVYWAAGLTIVGLIGYIPSLKKPSDLFMILIILAMLLQNKGFFGELQQGLQNGTGAGGAGTTATTGITGGSSSLTGLANSLFGNTLAAGNTSAGIGSGPLGTTTPQPGSSLDTGGIGAA